jgi:gluconate kinase
MKLHTAVCYLCLDEGNDENGQALRRNCACRGTDAGFVHLACLAEYAATRSVQAHTTAEFKDLWVECPSCHQQYRNELAVDIAKMFVLFVQQKYPEDAQRKAWAHLVKMCALMDMIDILQPEQKNEAKITTNELPYTSGYKNRWVLRTRHKTQKGLKLC